MRKKYSKYTPGSLVKYDHRLSRYTNTLFLCTPKKISLNSGEIEYNMRPKYDSAYRLTPDELLVVLASANIETWPRWVSVITSSGITGCLHERHIRYL